jgi:hypothetical protein
VSFVVAAFATGVIVARLKAVKAARMRYLIEILHLRSGRVPGFDGVGSGHFAGQ